MEQSIKSTESTENEGRKRNGVTKVKWIRRLAVEENISPKALKIAIIMSEMLRFDKFRVLGSGVNNDDSIENPLTGLAHVVDTLKSLGLNVTVPQLSKALNELEACESIIKEVRKPKGGRYVKTTGKRVVLRLNENYITKPIAN